jgi:hypothetical protein
MLATGCGTWSPPPTRSPVRRRHKSRPKPGRSQYVMEEKIIGRLGDLIRTWRMRHKIDSANAGIATAIPITSIVDAELDPRRYQKRPHTDITQYRSASKSYAGKSPRMPRKFMLL